MGLHVRRWQILLQKSFCTRHQNFFWLYARFSCKDEGGASSPDDKLTDDLRNAIEGISGRRWIFKQQKN
jgi:hypothetical protein